MGEVLGHQIFGVAAMSEKLWAQALGERLGQLNAATDARAAERLARYHAMLCDWNERMNLTGSTDFEDALDRHYLDSLAPLETDGLFPFGARLIDVGTGAGFPGMPLAIARPDLCVTLLDSLAKRLGFLSAVIEELGLVNVKLVHARAEDGGHDPKYREQFDIAVARAVAPLNVLSELLLPFVRVGGKMLCYKGPAARDEWAAGERAARLLGGGTPVLHPARLPSQPEWEHCVVAVQKTEKTVRQYPRKAGTPSRLPLGLSDKA